MCKASTGMVYEERAMEEGLGQNMYFFKYVNLLPIFKYFLQYLIRAGLRGR